MNRLGTIIAFSSLISGLAHAQPADLERKPAICAALRRFAHHRQFLKFCGLDLAKSQSGQQRGQGQLSKHGNNRLRSAFWFAGRIAVRSREHSVRDKFERYVATEPFSAARRRKAYTAIAAKMARIAHAVIKTGRPYRSYFEHELPSGSIPFKRAVEAPRTS